MQVGTTPKSCLIRPKPGRGGQSRRSPVEGPTKCLQGTQLSLFGTGSNRRLVFAGTVMEVVGHMQSLHLQDTPAALVLQLVLVW